jgi:hypothetical protein
MRSRAWCVRVLTALMFVAPACGSGALAPATCDAGAHFVDGHCAADVTCGVGTMLVGHSCMPSAMDGSSAIDAGVACGAGTTLDGSVCVATPVDAGSGTFCGPGTSLDRGECLPVAIDASEPVTCGPGTVLDGGACVPNTIDGGPPIVCGPGTSLGAGECVPSPADGGVAQFIVRVGSTTVGADGYSAIPVLVVGTDASGNPSTAAVVLGTSRAGAGTLTPSMVTLQPNGTTIYFVPCSAAVSATCAGPVRVTLALASAPSVVVAQSQEITLVAPQTVGSDTPCLAGGNVIFFNGDTGHYIFSGIETVTNGKWTATVTSTEVHVNVWPTDPQQGEWWDLYFDSSKLSAVLTTQVYDDATRWPFEAVGNPGFDVSGDGRGCNMESGRFQIEDLDVTNDSLTSFTATFEQHCESSSLTLRGCVHFEM